MPSSNATVDQASPSIVCGTLTSNGTTIDALVTAMPNTPCKAVWIGAPTLNTPGARVNTSDVLVGDSTYPNATIASDRSSDQYFQVDNANKLHFKFITSGDKLEYRIET